MKNQREKTNPVVRAIFKIPIPPTDNQRHQLSNRRIIDTRETKQWKRDAFFILKSQMHKSGMTFPIRGLVHVVFHFFLPDSWRGDVSNLQKLCQDMLNSPVGKQKQVGAGVIEDDRFVWSWSGKRHRITNDVSPCAIVAVSAPIENVYEMEINDENFYYERNVPSDVSFPSIVS